VERLALNVHESGYEFDQIICIARGGMRVGDVLSRIYERPLAILSTHSYAAEGGTIRGELVIAEHMTMTSPRLGSHVLLVDDMVDSGHTLAAVEKALPDPLAGHQGVQDRGAVVEGLFDGHARLLRRILPDNPWIHQPFEIYDNLGRKHSRSGSAPRRVELPVNRFPMDATDAVREGWREARRR
jgi:adenine/guanine phosphoribosyltransferase-like PRPP-binding protein